MARELTTTQTLESRQTALLAELARAEAKADREELAQMAAELASLERERDKVIPPLRKAAKAMRTARLKTEILLKSQGEAERRAVQVLTNRADQLDKRITQIKRHLRDSAPSQAAGF